jgi:zinc/manganese transport system permease protein
MELLPILVLPFIMCLLLAVITCYFGLHIIMRGVIFVDLALAQIAALGIVIALMAGYEADSGAAMAFSIVFTFAGALLFSLARFKEKHVPQEALIGITYVVASALAILLLDKSPHGLEEIESMLVGSILFVTKQAVWEAAAIYGVVAFIHYRFRKELFEISLDPDGSKKRGLNIFLYDLLFYSTFGLVVASSVRIAGVLMVFSYLIIPAVIAVMFADGLRTRLIIGWVLGFAGSVAGLFMSATRDMPTGAAVVVAFGAMLVISLLIWKWKQSRKPDEVVSVDESADSVSC